jgi:hypothetical protein
MSPSQANSTYKVLCPTLHLYLYEVRNSINDSPEIINTQLSDFQENLKKLASDLDMSSGTKAVDIIKFVKADPEPYQTLLDFTEINNNQHSNNVLNLDYSDVKRQLAAHRLNDTYFLRFTSYIPGEQPLIRLEYLSKGISTLKSQLGKTVILAVNLEKNQDLTTDIRLIIARECLKQYYPKDKNIEINEIQSQKILDSDFFIYQESQEIDTQSKYKIEVSYLTCVWLYENSDQEDQANDIYNLLNDFLLAYHKITFCYSQSIALKEILSDQYQKIEDLTDKNPKEWNDSAIITLPQDSLEYYKKLYSLQDQSRTIKINFKNYQTLLKKIQKLGNVPKLFTEFEPKIELYLKQIESSIGFLTPGLQLYEKLMLSVQTQVSIKDANLQKGQTQLGQLLTGSCAAIAIGQILAPVITATISQKIIDKNNSAQPSVSSLWLGALLTIGLSIVSGWFVSRWVYQWFTKENSSSDRESKK